MEDYNKIIESLSVRCINAKNIKILKPFILENFYDVENHIILLNHGEIFFGDGFTKLNEGEMLFLPGGKLTPLAYGEIDAQKIKNETFMAHKEKYIQTIPSTEELGVESNSYFIISLEAKVFDSVNFFTSIDMPAFALPKASNISDSIWEIMKETSLKLPGKEKIIKSFTERIVIEIIRHILEKRLFVEQLATNTTYFKDPRLVNIFSYIKDNLKGDLSNHVLADVANVSEDYVGQYFKMLTGINPQDYIEYQRMEKAVNLLRTSKQSIREISKGVGYKDTAYFCRRFKMMFGIPAGKMRRRESLINV